MGASKDGQDARLLHRLVDELPGMVAYWDADLRLVIANAAYRDFVDRPVEQLLGQHFSRVLGADVYLANLPHLQAALTGERRVFERTLADGLGISRHTEVSYSPHVVEGRVAGIFALITDVTARVEAQYDLDEAQEIAGLASWTYRLTDDTITWSRQLYRLARQDPELHAVPHWASFTAMIHPEDRGILDSLREHTEHGRGFDVRHRLAVNGEVRHVHSLSRPVTDGHGTVVMVRGTIQDETELMQQAKALETANRRLADLIGMLGHDLRQPLSAVLGYLEETVTFWDRDDSEQRRSQISRAFAAAQRLTKMLTDILAMVNPDSGAWAVRPERVGLAELVAKVLAQEHYAVQPHLEVRRSAEVAVDPFHLRQILGNLLANAAAYGAPPLLVVVDATEARATILVRDAGPGVPAAFVPRLFDRFTRAAGPTEVTSSGTGLGLYLVRELVHANGGTVDYRPASPVGSEFHIVFPTTS